MQLTAADGAVIYADVFTFADATATGSFDFAHRAGFFATRLGGEFSF